MNAFFCDYDYRHLPELPIWISVLTTAALYLSYLAVSEFLSPLRQVPGPWLWRMTSLRLAYSDSVGSRTRDIKELHDVFGGAVRIAPNEVSFAGLKSLKTIYGPGSPFERTSFYSMFDVYGKKNLFTFHSSKAHADRKKLVSHVYSQSYITGPAIAGLIERKAAQYLQMLEKEPEEASEIFRSLHYFSLDAITDFVYGRSGRTSSMEGNPRHRALLNDILDPARRRLSWYAVHLPRYTKWLLSRTGVWERVIANLGLLPMKKPTTYTGIRKHALEAFTAAKAVFKDNTNPLKQSAPLNEPPTVIDRLLHLQSTTHPELQDLDIASECADHLLAGVDTTADTLMFLVWALSLPENTHHQRRLRTEVSGLDARHGVVSVKEAMRLPFLHAVIHETLRLYNPLPATEPRSSATASLIEGFHIPARTVVGCSPFVLHREESPFPDPLAWDPERWISGPRHTGDLGRRWFWGFSSGARMCIGMHLAMAEMATLVASMYRSYETSLMPRDGEDVPIGSPSITSRFEVFYDEIKAGKGGVQEHECWIQYVKLVD